ncbi:MAG TPA: phenylalanine--tRNA ligase subunit beta, partial [Gemmatimonadaceae bacterium]
MNASYEWLKAFVPLDVDARQLRELITAHTATVDELVPIRTDLAPIVVARVLEASPHPDSDHLWFTKVDDGSGAPLEVVCGAANVTAGKLYPFARVGVTIPTGMKMERRKIRGIVSNGMLCSAKELGLGDNHEGILELNVDAAPGTPFLSAMPVGDMRLVIDVGANRPDLLSHMGLARELSAITGKRWTLPSLPGVASAGVKAVAAKGQGSTAGVSVHVDADTLTRSYMALVIRGVKIGASPAWLVERLGAVGSRSINNVVDATNYVLHEFGQPIHAFDLTKLKGAVRVRLARVNEEIVTLDGQARKLPAGAVVIADDSRSQAVAGVMGGRDSEVSDATTDLLIEVASFDPKLTRATRRALGLATDASYRFERGVDAGAGAVDALERVASIIVSLAGGKVAGDAVDIAADVPSPPEITLRSSRVRQVLGAEVPFTEARRFLDAAGFDVRSSNATELKVLVPSWRSDVAGEVDLVEEVARFHGYNKFPTEIRPFRPSSTSDDPLWALADRVRRGLAGMGYWETRPMPFVRGGDDTHVRVQNPLSEDEAFLRNR